MKGIFLYHSEGKARTHRLNFDVGAKAWEAVEIAVEKSTNITECRSRFNEDGMRSFVGRLQIYCD